MSTENSNITIVTAGRRKIAYYVCKDTGKTLAKKFKPATSDADIRKQIEPLAKPEVKTKTTTTKQDK